MEIKVRQLLGLTSFSWPDSLVQDTQLLYYYLVLRVSHDTVLLKLLRLMANVSHCQSLVSETQPTLDELKGGNNNNNHENTDRSMMKFWYKTLNPLVRQPRFSCPSGFSFHLCLAVSLLLSFQMLLGFASRDRHHQCSIGDLCQVPVFVRMYCGASYQI